LEDQSLDAEIVFGGLVKGHVNGYFASVNAPRCQFIIRTESPLIDMEALLLLDTTPDLIGPFS